MNSNRQLAAIVFADIAGYTAMMQEDETHALKIINTFRNSIETIVPPHMGQIIQFYGDGCLLIFTSTLQAIQCTIHLQTTFSKNPKVPVRIGIHSGEVLLEAGNIFGNAVNIAARIESMSIPGAILFSEKVKSELNNQAEVIPKSLGIFEFKNVKSPMEIFAHQGDNFPIPEKSEIFGKFKMQNEQKSIAVMPFNNRSSDSEQDYFADGVAEEIMIGLSKLENLRVAGRASTFSYKNSKLSISKIAEELKVDMILTGSIRKMGNRLRISAELVNPKDGFQVWADRYDKELQDIFAIQDEIAEQVVKNMRLILLGTEKSSSVVQRKTENIQAYQLYLQGKSYLDQRFKIEEAILCFEKAIALDPQFTAAYNSKAYAHVYSILLADVEPKKAFPLAEENILKALNIEPSNAESLTLQSWVAFYFNRNFEQALKGFERSIILDPNHADNYRIKAYMHGMYGQEEKAKESMQIAVQLDPLSFNVMLSLADLHFHYKELDRALIVLLKLEQKYPDNVIIKQLKAAIYLGMGDHTNSQPILDYLYTLPFTSTLQYNHYIFELQNGNKEWSVKYLHFLEKNELGKRVQTGLISLLHFYNGNKEKAKMYFEKAAADLDPLVIQILYDKWLIEYTQQPYVVEYHKEIGLIK